MKAPATRRDVFVRGRQCRGNYIGRGATGCPLANDSNHVSARYNVFVPRLRSRDVPAKKLIHQTREWRQEKSGVHRMCSIAACLLNLLSRQQICIICTSIDRLTESLKSFLKKKKKKRKRKKERLKSLEFWALIELVQTTRRICQRGGTARSFYTVELCALMNGKQESSRTMES